MVLRSSGEHAAEGSIDLSGGQQLGELEPRSPTKSHSAADLIWEVYWLAGGGGGSTEAASEQGWKAKGVGKEGTYLL